MRAVQQRERERSALSTAFITGITGQDGSYLAEELLADGWTVHGVSRGGVAFPDDSPWLGHERLTIVDADLLDWPSVERALSASEPDLIFNFAGLSSVAESWKRPALALELNSVAVAHLLEWCLARNERGIQAHLVQASSAEIFDNTSGDPRTEATHMSPINPYGVAKAAAHSLIKIYRSRGLHASNAILYNHESPRRPGAFVTRKITSAAARIAAGSGETLALGTLDVRRDWGWAPDYSHAMHLMAVAPEPGDYIVASGVSHSVRDFVAAAFDAAGVPDWEGRITIDPSFIRPSDPQELVGDASAARAALGWVPTVPFEEIVARMVDADRRALAL